MTTEIGFYEIITLIALFTLLITAVIYTAYVDHQKLMLLQSLPDGPEKDSAILRAFPPSDYYDEDMM